MKPVAWRRKSCPRCKGDIFLHNGLDGWEWECLQCSRTYRVRLVNKVPLPDFAPLTPNNPPITDHTDEHEEAA